MKKDILKQMKYSKDQQKMIKRMQRIQKSKYEVAQFYERALECIIDSNGKFVFVYVREDDGTKITVEGI